jgi:hypothetical protein
MFYIFKETHDNSQINDRNTAKPNIIFDTLVHEEASRVHTNRYLRTPHNTVQSSLTSAPSHTFRPAILTISNNNQLFSYCQYNKKYNLYQIPYNW